MKTPSSSSSEAQVINSDFLDGAAPRPELGVIILNWKLPPITPHLLRKGEIDLHTILHPSSKLFFIGKLHNQVQTLKQPHTASLFTASFLPIHKNPNHHHLTKFAAAFFICADGGANRLHDEVPAMFTDQPPHEIRRHFLPHLIKGDLDSIRPDVTAYYEQAGVPIIDLSADQDSTDLQKCLNYVREHKMAQPLDKKPSTSTHTVPIRTIVVLGAHGGRLDHILANLSTLHQYRDMDIVLCGDGNLTRLVKEGKSVIRPYRALEGPSCGLIPLQGKVTATSSGLKWNLEDMEMVIGGLVSACNVIVEDEVFVETTGDLIWTTQLREEEEK